jgi:hypothetical protein
LTCLRSCAVHQMKMTGISVKMTTREKIGCLGSVFYLLSIPVFYVLRGWTLATLWGWFVVPIFELPVLPLGYAVGLMYIVWYIQSKFDPDASEAYKDSEKWTQRVWSVLVYGYLTPVVYVGVGWVILQFVK